VSDMSHMFDGATNFNQTLYDWDTRKVTKHIYFSDGAGFRITRPHFRPPF